MMFSKVRLTVRLLILATLSIGCELANTSIAVANASFETIPISGLPFVDCASGCSYSNGSIPGWINAGFLFFFDRH